MSNIFSSPVTTKERKSNSIYLPLRGKYSPDTKNFLVPYSIYSEFKENGTVEAVYSEDDIQRFPEVLKSFILDKDNYVESMIETGKHEGRILLRDGEWYVSYIIQTALKIEQEDETLKTVKGFQLVWNNTILIKEYQKSKALNSLIKEQIKASK